VSLVGFDLPTLLLVLVMVVVMVVVVVCVYVTADVTGQRQKNLQKVSVQHGCMQQQTLGTPGLVHANQVIYCQDTRQSYILMRPPL
jgi:type II secretory pathway component PulK